MKNLIEEIRNKLPVGATAIHSEKGKIVFIECCEVIGDLADIIETLDEKGYTLVQGIQHIIVPAAHGHSDLYSATLRKS